MRFMMLMIPKGYETAAPGQGLHGRVARSRILFCKCRFHFPSFDA
jgi:hypothetical protein